MTLVIFTLDSQTLLFEQVEGITVLDGEISFTHHGMSLSERRRATFFTDRIAGYSYTA